MYVDFPLIRQGGGGGGGGGGEEDYDTYIDR